MTRAAELHWEGFEVVERGLLRAAIRVAGARHARVTVTVSLEGDVCDVQASDCAHAGTTGEHALDEAVCELVRDRLAVARDAAAYAHAQRQRDGSPAPRRRARR